MSALSPFLRITRRSVALACAALLAVAIGPAREVTAQTFTCELGKTTARVQGGRFNRTRSTTFEDIPSTELRFTQGPGRPGCVIVQFSGAAYAGKDRLMWIRVVLDAEATGTRIFLSPGDVPFAGNDDESVRSDAVRARTFNFAARGIEPGEYTARVQWASIRGGAVYMHEQIVIVQHQ